MGSTTPETLTLSELAATATCPLLGHGKLYKGGWRFRLAAEPFALGEDEIAGEYAIVGRVENEMTAYFPPPDLVLAFANLAATAELKPVPPSLAAAAQMIARDQGFDAGSTEQPPCTLSAIPPDVMRRFLERYGPLTGETGMWAGQFTHPVETLAEALGAASKGDLERGFRITLELYRETELGDLLGVLAVQALALLFRGSIPKRCPAHNCGRFFYLRDEPGATFKRRDAVYCTRTCQNRESTRRARQRVKERAAKTRVDEAR